MSEKIKSNKELCQWLRDNSSGVYRPSAMAADIIEAQADRIEASTRSFDVAIDKIEAMKALMAEAQQLLAGSSSVVDTVWMESSPAETLYDALSVHTGITQGDTE